jgi:hypothetical protein
MNKTILRIVGIALVIGPAFGSAQSKKPNAATFITKEEIDAVNKAPGIDRTIKVVDIGNEHFAVGVVHRGPSVPPAFLPLQTPKRVALRKRTRRRI